MGEVHIVPSVDRPERNHLELQWSRGCDIQLTTKGPRGSFHAVALVSLADLKAAVEELEKEALDA